MYLEMINENIMKKFLAESAYTFTAEEMDRIIERIELTRQEDFLWYAVRHAEAYVDVQICGRAYLDKLEKNGISDTELSNSCIDHFYPDRRGKYLKLNESARWWGFIFSPMLSTEKGKPKIWIRFPDDEKLYWFFIDGYTDKDGLIVSPNPRMIKSMNHFKKFEKEFKDITSSYRETIKFARKEAYDFFERNQDRTPDHSNLHERIAFLVHPFPVRKPGDNVMLDVHPCSYDDYWRKK